MIAYLVLVIAGFAAGYIDTIAGGSGMITLPAYLMFGLPPHLALGTNKLSSTLCVANAARIFIRKKIFRPEYWLSSIFATFAGGIIGALMVHLVSSDFLKKLLPAVILCLGVYVAIPKKYTDTSHSHYKPRPLSSSVLGSVLGFYDGFIGPGSGSFWVVTIMAIYKINLVEATAVAKLMNFTSNLAALMIFIIFGTIDYKLALLVGAAMMSGAYLGAHSALRWGAGFIRPLFLVVVFAIGILLAWQVWF